LVLWCCELESYVSDINTTADISIECTQSVPSTDIGVDESYTDTTICAEDSSKRTDYQNQISKKKTWTLIKNDCFESINLLKSIDNSLILMYM
jgi:hypothetical protein